MYHYLIYCQIREKLNSHKNKKAVLWISNNMLEYLWSCSVNNAQFIEILFSNCIFFFKEPWTMLILRRICWRVWIIIYYHSWGKLKSAVYERQNWSSGDIRTTRSAENIDDMWRFGLDLAWTIFALRKFEKFSTEIIITLSICSGVSTSEQSLIRWWWWTDWR